MGSIASSCVRDCVRSSHEHATEDLLHVSVEAPGLASGSRTPGGTKQAPHQPLIVPDIGNPKDGGSSAGTGAGIVPPVPNWFQVLQTNRQERQNQTETPRFDEVVQSSRLSTDRSTPRGNIGGEFRTPGPTPRDSPRTSEGEANAAAGNSDEVSYEGMYLGTMKHGQGKLRMTSSTYQGDFLNDQKHGQGMLTWDDGRRYRGGFECNKFHGHAVMTWPDGRKYTGYYTDDRKHGEGTFSWQDGRRYQGQWVCGKRHGTGIYTNAKGLTRRGMWQMDRPIHWEVPGAELQQPGWSARSTSGTEQPAAIPEAAAPEVTPRDPLKLEVAVAQAVELNSQRKLPLASPREADEEMEMDLEIKAKHVALKPSLQEVVTPSNQVSNL
eukprot:CAMPEP_0115189906 /NCGR_PEP_ID=MMETSP0270-20121206/11754_1 /TAXON_ID=71861 /ORGANISM="Scrippsiella trochoidea, Strain CCMP3099" /LENGTH=380 /DNA_ID=CAMNT_0002603107 /DNA_START=71 /DNA_END=1213 /DNA_ORIENTATION=-